ncbi:hypothetical protein DIS24_g10994 [Lasiodiplodia hormozganensis]|uniref:Uncharacterized protein n=1 Tax=Lasiodiplodia hormozganensis TaxID=869390 RepID=A0AA40C5D8_9PEZI|nr:hypothetical protein DIS24_g10994 [Lasiodiplodia hormozganensis]
MDSPEKNLSQLPDGGDHDNQRKISDQVLHKFMEKAKSQPIRTAPFVKSGVLHVAFGSPVLQCFAVSSFDGLLYAGSAITEDLKNKPFIQRKKIAERAERHTKRGCWIPFDVNHIEFPTPTTDARTSPRDDIQREGNCQFIISSYDLAIDTLILIPHPLMHLMTKATEQPDHFPLATRIPRVLAHLAFPAYKLPEALENVRQAVSTGVYVNPHNDLQIPFKPKLFKLSEVDYTPISTTSSVEAARGFSILFKAIETSQKAKEEYFLSPHPYQSRGCDAIIHGPEKAEWDVEIKLQSHIEVGPSLVLHYQDVDAKGNVDPTAPFGVWYFLMLYDESEKLCYWIPRDKMKMEWSPASLGCTESGVIRIPKQDVAAFRIDCRHSDWFSHVVDRIILPHKDVPFDSVPTFKQIAEARSNPHFDFLTPNKVKLDRDGEGQDNHGVAGEDIPIRRTDRVEPFWLFWIFQAQCALSKEGLFLVLDGDRSAGNYAYIRWAWTDKEVETFFDKGISPTFIGHDFVTPHALAVPIHLHQVDTSGASKEQGTRHYSVDVDNWRKEKHIIIGDTLLDTSTWNSSRGIYLIPSGEFCDEPRATFHRHGSEKLSALLTDNLPKNKLASSYIVSSDDIVRMLQNLMTEAHDSFDKPVRFGGAQIIPDDYVVLLGDLIG